MLKQAAVLTAAFLLAACVPPLEKPATSAIPHTAHTAAPPNQFPQALSQNLPVFKIGLLLPLSGESASLGSSLLDAASLAVYDSTLALTPEQTTARIILVPKDAGVSPAETAQATQQLVEQGVSLILGPLFAANMPAAAEVAQAKHVPLISFSNNRALAKPGTMIFGFVPEQQIDRVADYALQHNLTRLAILAPNDAYGVKVKATLSDAASRNGGQLKQVELYSASQANLDAAVSRLAQAYATQPFDARIQALFIAEGGQQMRNILDSMKKYQLDPHALKLLGTGQWDDESMFANNDLTGAWFASAPPNASRSFAQRFKATYHYTPARIASLSYDAVTLATRLAMAGHGVIDQVQLMNPQGYATPANGLLRFTASGVAERRLAVLEITPHGPRVLDPAPKRF